ncbi:MAG: hypothetical protein CMA68_04430 [Euryarchaeota archaeon]|nr:hypothetical protein [Euryarchaeota archaeon]
MVFANSGGKTGQSTAGCTCHSNTSPISPSLSGLPWGAGGYTPGSTYSLVWDGGPHISGDGGFNLAASAGSWSSLGTDVQLASGELTHSSDASRSWSADWTAPTSGTGDVDFDLAVLYANGNSMNSGDSWGTGTWTLSEAGPTNNPPTASNVYYIPSNPTKATGLGVSYTYDDADGDSEQGTTIRWYRDGLRVSQIDDQTDVPNSWIARGQSWRVEVTPSDGDDQGDTVSLNPVTIGNTIPIARNLAVSPNAPLDTDDLTLDWEYYDLDGNPQDSQQTTIHWFLDGSRVTELDGEQSVSSIMIRSDDEWEVAITPHDGTDFGDTITSGKIIIGSSNNQPTVNGYVNPPGNAVTSDALQLSYSSFDSDGDIIQDVEIRWYRDGVRVSAFNDEQTVDPSFTSKGETWYSKVRVFDGLVWSEWFETGSVLIGNTPPVVTSITMLPEGPLTTSTELSVVWEQTDIDGDQESGSQIRWWVDGEWVRDYDDMTAIPASLTIRDQHWSVQVLPGDGESLGSSMKTTSRSIDNAAPSSPEVSLENVPIGALSAQPDSLSDIIAVAISYDPDGEPVSYTYMWFRNGFHVPDLDGQSVVDQSRLEPGATWGVEVTASDPWGMESTSFTETLIANVPPIASWESETSPPTPGAMATFDASSSSDPDGTISSYIWLINGVGLTGKSVDVLLPSGTHSVSLTVIDDMGMSNTISNQIMYGDVITVDSLEATLSGSTVTLSWSSGSSEEFRVYRSTSPISTVVGLTSMDEMPGWGELTPIQMSPEGTTSLNTWSEEAPVSATLYYVVTTVVDGNEVVWVMDGLNHVSVDASMAGESVSESQDSTPVASIAISAILFVLGAAAIGISMVERKRRGF